ncbi:hypothetical protein M8J77_012330 [Diaphorina citri]|nr:hypothetical protein M8J77_012330 [Diaphorina citri]
MSPSEICLMPPLLSRLQTKSNLDGTSPSPKLGRLAPLHSVTYPISGDSNVLVLAKLRFAFPTKRLLDTIFPGSPFVSKKKFRGIRDLLLSWPFGRALIFSPSSISMNLRGSEDRHRQFLQAMTPILSLCVSREEANRHSGLENSGSSDIASTAPLPDKIPSPPFEPLTSPPPQPSADSSRLSAL